MKGLLYKDARIMATSFRTLPIMVLIFLVVSVINQTGAFWSVYGIFIGCTMISTLQNVDENSKWCTYCDTLPITRADLVKEKYLLALIAVVLSIAALVILRLVLSLFGIGPGMEGLGVVCITMAMAGILASSLNLVTAFLFGPQKSQIARLVLIIAMVVVCMAIINYVPGLLATLAGLPPVILLMLGVVLPLAFAFLCYRISCIGFEKRILL